MITMSFFFFQAEDGIRDYKVTGVQTCALPISRRDAGGPRRAPGGRHFDGKALVDGLPGAPDLRPGARRSRAGAPRRDRRARGRAGAPRARRRAAHSADDGLSQRLRATIHGGPRVRGPVGGQVHDFRGRERARHQARDGVRRPRAAAPARCPGAAAAGALPRRAPAGRGPGRFLLPHRQRRVTKRRRRGGRAVTHFYPAFLDLRGRRAVVVGGGAIAEQKVVALLDAGARVSVISPSVSRRLDDLEAAGTVTIERRPYRPGDLAGAVLPVAATDGPRAEPAGGAAT